jgi:hypothetical protein
MVCDTLVLTNSALGSQNVPSRHRLAQYYSKFVLTFSCRVGLCLNLRTEHWSRVVKARSILI